MSTPRTYPGSMNQPAHLVQRLFVERLRQAHVADPHGWVLVEDLSREAFGLPGLGLPTAGPTAKGSLTLAQRTSVRRTIRDLSSQGRVEFAEQLPTERRRTAQSGPALLRGRRRSIWARLATEATEPLAERRDRSPLASLTAHTG